MVAIGSSPRRAGGLGLLRHWPFFLLASLFLISLAAFSLINNDSSAMSSAVLNALEESKTIAMAQSKSVRGAADNTLTSISSFLSEDSNNNNIDNTGDDVHKVAGLSCSKYGGPSVDVAAEMVYWRDIPSDASFISPFQKYGPETKYLTFEPDEGGWNNIRMSMETAVAMAHAMGRTLVLPPEQKIYLLNQKNDKSKNSFTFHDFFHFESVAIEHPGVQIISMQEFLEREIITGNIRHPVTGDIMIPPENRTNWDGIGTYHSNEFKKLAEFLRSAGFSSKWKNTECIAVFPDRSGPGTTPELEKMLSEILKEGDGRARERSYTNNPTPVDAPAKDRMREALSSFRQKICVYNDGLQQAPIFHFQGGGDYRLLVHFYAFMFFEDWRQDLWTKRFIRDHLRYVDEIQCAAARVVAAMRAKARQHGNPDGLFDTFHIRRGDFQYKDTRIEAQDIVDNVKDLLAENSTVYIATDETRNKTFFDPLRKHYHVYFLDDFKEEVGDINSNYLGMMDQRIASRGRNFFGTYYSTFTGYITRMRGYHSQIDSEEAVKTGETPSYYFVPKDFMNSVHRYQSIRIPFWSREFPVSWRDIDRGVDEMANKGGNMFVARAR